MPIITDSFDTEPRNWRARLAASVELMRELSRHSDPQEMYEVFSRRMDELFPVSRRLSVSRRGLRYPEFRVTRFNLWKDRVNPWKEPGRLPHHDGGFLAELLYADEPKLHTNLVLDADDPANEYLAGQRSILSIPLYDHGASLTALILSREEMDAFPRDRIPDLLMLSNLFSRTTQSLVLSQAVREAYDAVDFEMRSVADIQQALLPPEVPRPEGIDVAVRYFTAKRAGGDYYDFFPLPDGRFGVLVADASGHGAPATVLMAMTHSITHTLPDPVRPGQLLTHLNAHLALRYTRPTGSFVTAFYAVCDPRRGILTYASAGHSPPRLSRGTDGSLTTLNRAQRLPLGIKQDEVYPEQSIAFLPGDRVVFFTDGVIEAVDTEGDVFGTGRIDDAISRNSPSAESTLESIMEAWMEFTQSVSPTDDRTLVVIRRI